VDRVMSGDTVRISIISLTPHIFVSGFVFELAFLAASMAKTTMKPSFEATAQEITNTSTCILLFCTWYHSNNVYYANMTRAIL
jgi:hypothetical protein